MAFYLYFYLFSFILIYSPSNDLSFLYSYLLSLYDLLFVFLSVLPLRSIICFNSFLFSPYDLLFFKLFFYSPSHKYLACFQVYKRIKSAITSINISPPQHPMFRFLSLVLFVSVQLPRTSHSEQIINVPLLSTASHAL